MIFVDAGYVIALASSRDSLHNRAMAWVAAIRGERLLITEYVVLEVLDRLASPPPDRRRAEVFADEARGGAPYEFVPASPALLDAGLDLYRRHRDKAWGLTDCTSFALMRQRGVTRALAHDHHFEQAGFEALMRRDP